MLIILNLSGLKRITYWFDSEEPTGDVNVIFETNATSFTDEEKNSAPNEYPFTIDAAENNGAKKLYVKAEFLSGKSTIISKDIDIDTVAPKVDLVYDNNNAQNGEYFNKERTATLTVTERSDHFDKNTAKNNIVIKQFNGKGEVIDEPQYTIGEWNTTQVIHLIKISTQLKLNIQVMQFIKLISNIQILQVIKMSQLT